jgi:ABC-2 type transport system permease protein
VTRLLSGELLKLRTTRTAIAFALAAIVLVLLVVLLSILSGDPQNVPDKRDAVNFGGTTAFVLLIFGVVGATGEYRHRTLAPSLLVAPDRARLTVARMVAYGITGLLIGLLMLVVAFGIGLPLLAGQPGRDLASSDLLKTGGGGVLSVALSAMLGVGIGVLVRNQVAAVVGTLVWFFIVEPLLTLVSDQVYEYSISQSASAVAGTQGSDYLSFGVAVLVLAGWAALFVAVGAFVDARRDVT